MSEPKVLSDDEIEEAYCNAQRVPTDMPATLGDRAQLVASIVVGLCILGACFSCVFGGAGR